MKYFTVSCQDINTSPDAAQQASIYSNAQTHSRRKKEFSSQAPLSSRAAKGSRGLLCGSGLAWSMWRRGTSEAGGLWTLCSSAVSMLSDGSRMDDEPSLRGHQR